MTKRQKERARKISEMRRAARRLGYFATERDSLYVGPGISVTINSNSGTIGTLNAMHGCTVIWRCDFPKTPTCTDTGRSADHAGHRTRTTGPEPSSPP